MFDFSKLGDLSKMANQAKQLQANQEIAQKQQMELLEKISKQLQEIISLIKKG